MNLEQLHQQQNSYQASEATKAKNTGKVLTLLIAPTATGKSTLANKVTKTMNQNGESCEVTGLVSTRPSRTDDPDNYQTSVPVAKMIKMIEAGELANYAILHGKEIYAYKDFNGQYNLAPSVPEVIETLSQAGFDRTNVIYIVANIDDWQNWLGNRADSPKTKARMQEAAQSLEFAISNANQIDFVENSSQPNGLQEAAQRIIDLTLGSETTSEEYRARCLNLAIAMLEFARQHAE